MIRAFDDTDNGVAWLRRAIGLARTGTRDNSSPWHLFSLATVEEDGPAVRTVGLRGVEEEPFGIEFWTDRRSFKVDAFARDAAAMFWDPDTSIQLRLRGPVGTFGPDDARSAELIGKLPEDALLNYATLSAPGRPPERGEEPDARDVALASENFLRCALTAERADLVHLGDERDRRFRYTFDPFRCEEVVP